MNNKDIINEIKKNIQIKDTILEDMENITTLDPETEEYKYLKSKIINVDENKIKK